MSRYTVTVKTDGETDENAVIGYDPPLRTWPHRASCGPPEGSPCPSPRLPSRPIAAAKEGPVSEHQGRLRAPEFSEIDFSSWMDNELLVAIRYPAR